MLDEVNLFELFGLKQTFDIDTRLLDKRFIELQKSLHPDNYISSDDDELVKYSTIYSSYVNEGYNILKNDFERAKYLLKEDIPEDHSTQDMELLSKVMDAREQIEYASSIAELEYIKASIESDRKDIVSEISTLFNLEQTEEAIALLVKLKYHNRIIESIEQREREFL